MEYYQLREDEVVLYKGKVVLYGKDTQIVLTNHNIVFIPESTAQTEIHSVEDIKIYKEQPQVKVKGNTVEIYFLTTEKEFKFKSIFEIPKFTNAVKNLLTGKTKTERGAEKVKKTINLVNETFNIDCVKGVGEIIKNATQKKSVTINIGAKNGSPEEKSKIFSDIGKDIGEGIGAIGKGIGEVGDGISKVNNSIKDVKDNVKETGKDISQTRKKISSMVDKFKIKKGV